MEYDVIGDIHGHATELRALLRSMGYSESGGAWRHPGRQALFVGDLIDRGPEQVGTVTLVRRMVDAGSAQVVMGNHEFNAIAWATPDPHLPGDFLRTHEGPKGEKNRRQHARFLAEVGEGSARHRELIAWFKTFPLWRDLPGLRVVHACWAPPAMEILGRILSAEKLLDDPLLASVMKKPAKDGVSNGSVPSLYGASETVLKGMEVPLPPGLVFEDKDGHARKEARVRWWDPAADTFRKAAITSAELAAALPDEPIPGYGRLSYDGEKPVFFGHYWMTGTPEILTPKAACLDYSVARGGCLCAYRWGGESELDPRNFRVTPA